MLNNYFNRPRKKAWVGTAIAAGSALLGLGSSIFGANKQKKLQEEQFALQQAMQSRNVGVSGAANLTQSYANNYELNKEFVSGFKRMGGRKKCEAGTWTKDNTISLINNLGNIASNFATNVIGQARQSNVFPTAIKPMIDNKNNNAIYDSAARSNFLNNYYRTSVLRCGGSKIRRR